MITPRAPGLSPTKKVVVRRTEGLSRRWTHSDIDQVRSGLARGSSVEDIGRKLDRDPCEVLTLAKQLRMKLPVETWR